MRSSYRDGKQITPDLQYIARAQPAMISKRKKTSV